MTTNGYIVEEATFPALYRAADAASLRGQKRHMALIKLDLFLMVFGAFAGVLSFDGSCFRGPFAIVTALTLIGSAAVTWAIFLAGFAKVWYAGRALAESVKTLAWKYMTRAEPFVPTLDRHAARGMFIDQLARLLEQRQFLGAEIGQLPEHAEQITAEMQRIHDMGLAERREYYLHCRIEDQSGWYSSKSVANRNLHYLWLAVLSGSQVAGGLWALAAIYWEQIPIGMAAAIAAVATAAFSWLQAREFQRLAQSYGIAAHELSMIAAKIEQVKTDEELSQVVADAENAISREHTLWIARQDYV